MANSLTTAVRGKGIRPFLYRAGKIARSYGCTAARMDRALEQMTDVLREHDCPATMPITASALLRNQYVVRNCLAKGLELAVHGYLHVDYTQLTLEQQRRHIQAALQAFAQAGVHAAGFRSPYLRWNSDTLTVLQECGFSYDSSQALAWEVVAEMETEDYRKVLGFYHAQKASEHPSLPKLDGGLVRIPYCLPDDEALVERLKLQSCEAMSEIWLSMLERIYAAGELFTLGLHPERAVQCEDALRAVLAKARSLSPPVWIARLDEVAAWYRSLGKASFEAYPQTDGSLQVRIEAPERATVLARSVDVEAAHTGWAFGYDRFLSSQIILRCKKRPWIGLPPDHPAALKSFLQHQGYLVEISPDPAGFSYYFQLESFTPNDERPVLARIENGEEPLLRLGRWPSGAQAALAISGDVDAITLFDFGFRLIGR